MCSPSVLVLVSAHPSVQRVAVEEDAGVVSLLDVGDRARCLELAESLDGHVQVTAGGLDTHPGWPRFALATVEVGEHVLATGSTSSSIACSSSVKVSVALTHRRPGRVRSATRACDGGARVLRRVVETFGKLVVLPLVRLKVLVDAGEFAFDVVQPRRDGESSDGLGARYARRQRLRSHCGSSVGNSPATCM